MRHLIALTLAIGIAGYCDQACAQQQYDAGGKARVSTYCKTTLGGDTPCPATGGGGGGGASTIADGADVAEGAKADAAWVSGSGSLIALEKYIAAQLATLNTNVTSAIPAGTNLIGKVGIDQTTPGTTNAVSATNLPTTVSTGTGAQGASSPRVTVATDTATIAGSAPSTVLLSQPVPGAANGLTTFYLTPANSTNATNVKASAGTLYDVELTNNSATPAYLSFYNTAGTPTCGTGIVGQAMFPANSTSGAGWVSNSALGKAFSTGIGICAATGIAGTGSVAATTYTITLGYK